MQGTESSETSVFLLNVAASDTEDLDTSPPGLLVVPENFDASGCLAYTNNIGNLISSPFGYNAGCSIDDFQ